MGGVIRKLINSKGIGFFVLVTKEKQASDRARPTKTSE